MYKLFVLLALAVAAHANFYITAPVAKDKWRAGKVQKLVWHESGEAPLVASFGRTRVDLCLGTPTEQTCILHLGTIDPKKARSKTVKIPVKTGPAGEYFIRMQSLHAKDDCNEPLAAWSAPFQVTGLAGKPIKGVQLLANNATTASAGASSSQGIWAGARTGLLPPPPAPSTSTTVVATATADATAAPPTASSGATRSAFSTGTAAFSLFGLLSMMVL